jgi:hypothetical protein
MKTSPGYSRKLAVLQKEGNKHTKGGIRERKKNA